MKKKAAIFEFLAAACLILEDGSMIVEALDFYRLFQPDSWQMFLDELKDNIDLKVAYFMLVNTLIVNSNEAKDRRKIRSNFMGPEIFELYKEDEFEEDVKEQLAIYQEEYDNDKESESGEELGHKINILIDGLPEADRKDLKELINSLLLTLKLRPEAVTILNSIVSKISKVKEKDVNKVYLLASLIKEELESDKHGELSKALNTLGISPSSNSSEKKEKKNFD